MFITGDILREKGACVGQAEIFEKEWPDGAEVNEANAQRAVELSLDLNWFAAEFLSPPAWKVYYEAIAPASKVYDEARATAWKVYDKAIAPAWKVYDKARATAWKVYYKARATALVKAEKIYDQRER